MIHGSFTGSRDSAAAKDVGTGLEVTPDDGVSGC